MVVSRSEGSAGEGLVAAGEEMSEALVLLVGVAY